MLMLLLQRLCSPETLHLSPILQGNERLFSRRAYATVLRQSIVCLSVCTECIAAKRCVLEQNLLLTTYRSRI